MSDNINSLPPRTVLSHDNISIPCCYAGQGEPLLLFIHGWTCTRSYWEPQLTSFKEKYQVAAPDLPGHGDADAGGRQSWRVVDLARDVETCIRRLNPEQTILIGHSMGGAVALEAARILKEKVSAVVLVDTFVIDYGGLDCETIQRTAAPFESDFPSAIAGLIENTSTEATPGILKESLIREMSGADPAWALPLWRDLLSWSPKPAFEELKIPIHAINGALIPESARNRCAPYVTETIIPGAGHFLQMEDPEAFNRVLEDVLSGLT